MTQLDLGLNLSTKRTRKREFLDEMRRVVPWLKLIALVEPHCAKGKTGRPPFPVAKMLQMHFMQQLYGRPPFAKGRHLRCQNMIRGCGFISGLLLRHMPVGPDGIR